MGQKLGHNVFIVIEKESEVGLVIARISRGRTIREFVFGVLLIPLGFTLAWMSIFGNSAIDQVLNHGMAALGQSAIDDPSMSLYLLLETYPWSKTVIAVTVFISFVFFVTSAAPAPWCSRRCRPRAVTPMKTGRSGCVCSGAR